MKEKTVKIKKFLVVLFLLMLLMAIYFFENGMNEQNTTALALSYQYGFIPRGLIGTIVALLEKVGLFHYTYHSAMLLSAAATILCYGVLFIVYYFSLKRCDEKYLSIMQCGIIFISLFLFSEYMTVNNFGRLDEYLMIITLICFFLLVTEKADYLIIPLCMLGTMIHAGFVFTNIAVILVLLLWKIFTYQGKKQKKYICIFTLTFLAVSVLFLYFEFLRQPVSTLDYQQVIDKANALAQNGAIQKDAYSLLKSELLKEDVFNDEWIWHTKNYAETPIFLLLFFPYILIGISFFRNLIRDAEEKIMKMKYMIIAGGIATIIPELILKVDYGRWFFCIIMYYCLVLLALVVLGDQRVMYQMDKTIQMIQNKVPFAWILLFYPLLFVPFRDVYISDVTTWIMDNIEAPILGLW